MPPSGDVAPIDVQRVTIPDAATWSSLVSGACPGVVQGDLVIQVCHAVVSLPEVVLGDDLLRASAWGITSLLAGVVDEAEREGAEAGRRSHVVKLGSGRILETFIQDESHVYLAIQSNAGGSLQLEVSVRWRDLVAVVERIVQTILTLLDLRSDPEDVAPRSRFLGNWEALRMRALAVDGHLTIPRETDDPLADA
ncbi:MAG: hypothetical protein VKP72_00850 [bacterium]|nr:hypothetical protein [bacterium]